MARILNITNHPVFPMNFGGASVIHRFLEGLAERGHQVTLVAWRTGAEPPAERLPYRFVGVAPSGLSPVTELPGDPRLPVLPDDRPSLRVRAGNWVKRRWPALFGAYWKTRWALTCAPIFAIRLARRFRRLRDLGAFLRGHDCVIVDYPFVGFWVWAVARAFGLRFIVHSHNIEAERLCSMDGRRHRLLHAYEGWVYRRADRVLFISEEDARYARERMGVAPERAVLCPYGTDLGPASAGAPAPLGERLEARAEVQAAHGLAADERLVLYFGKLDYAPNIEGYRVLLDEIVPRLRERAGVRHRVLVCGHGLPAGLLDHPAVASGQVIYAGCVPRIETYLSAVDLVVNPILSGGGVKTKVIEALALHRTVVATASGAVGIEKSVCGSKLRVVGDRDWDGFAAAVAGVLREGGDARTPDGFYDRYSMDRILRRVEERCFAEPGFAGAVGSAEDAQPAV